jgi:carbon-monoxide dehydrogenase medium subunit
VSLAPFEVHRPASIGEASRLLRALGDDATLYGGGTELLLLFKLGLVHFAHLIDVKHINGLAGIRARDGWLAIGAATTHRVIERSAFVREHSPELASMEHRVANIRVRSVGTLGGNLCFADPHSDPATFLLVLNAMLVCATDDAAIRSVHIDEFVRDAYETDLRIGELLTEIRLPPVPEHAAISHQRFAIHERPSATVTSLIQWRDNRVNDARVSVGSVGSRPMRATGAERELLGVEPDQIEAHLERAAGAAAAAAECVSDQEGSAEYKAHLVSVLVKRSVREAAARALEKSPRATDVRKITNVFDLDSTAPG